MLIHGDTRPVPTWMDEEVFADWEFSVYLPEADEHG